MFDNQLRHLKERLLEGVARRLLTRLSPLYFTIGAFLLGCAAAAALLAHYRWGAFWLWVVSRLADGLDGTVARLSGRQSNIGGYFDLLLDVILYALIPLAAATQGSPTLYWLVALLLASYYINVVSWLALSALLEKQRQVDESAFAPSAARLTSIRMPTGVMEGGETVLLYGLICLLPRYLAYLFIAGSVLALLGAGQRALWAIRHRRLLG